MGLHNKFIIYDNVWLNPNLNLPKIVLFHDSFVKPRFDRRTIVYLRSRTSFCTHLKISPNHVRTMESAIAPQTQAVLWLNLDKLPSEITLEMWQESCVEI